METVLLVTEDEVDHAGSWFSARQAGVARLLPKPPEEVAGASFGSKHGIDS